MFTAFWYGGCNYSGGIELIPYPSIEFAKNILLQRYNGVDPISGLSTPLVDENCYISLRGKDDSVYVLTLKNGEEVDVERVK